MERYICLGRKGLPPHLLGNTGQRNQASGRHFSAHQPFVLGSFTAAVGETVREARGMCLNKSLMGTLILGPQALKVKSLLLGIDSALLSSSENSPALGLNRQPLCTALHR